VLPSDHSTMRLMWPCDQCDRATVQCDHAAEATVRPDPRSGLHPRRRAALRGGRGQGPALVAPLSSRLGPPGTGVIL
jgi:hypothetical protein